MTGSEFLGVTVMQYTDAVVAFTQAGIVNLPSEAIVVLVVPVIFAPLNVKFLLSVNVAVRARSVVAVLSR